MALFEVSVEVDDLTAPAMLVAFDGWVNAGSVGTATAEHIAEPADAIATFDSDALFDYRANRPVIDFVDGIMDEVRFPEMTLWRRDLGDRDLLILTGTEPNWNWKAFGGAIADLAVKLGVVEQVSVGGIPSAVPHTRPTRILSTASRPDLIGQEEAFPEGLLRVPGAAVSVVESFVVKQGLAAVGFWAQAPHYVVETYYPGVVSLVERVALHLGVPIPLGSLVDDAAEQRERLDSIVATQEQAGEYIRQLENISEAEGPVPSGEEIAAEIERFLEGEDPFGDAEPDDVM